MQKDLNNANGKFNGVNIDGFIASQRKNYAKA